MSNRKIASRRQGRKANLDLKAAQISTCAAEENRATPQNMPQDAPLPRAKRQPRCAKADRGLPPDAELRRLATEYLSFQRKFWPESVAQGLLPESTEAVIDSMVEDFKNRHRTSIVASEPLRAIQKMCPKLGGSYNRYSCDNSSPTSILDQMTKALGKAHQEMRFVPWSYVFCDYSVSGLISYRQGYSSYKRILGDPTHLIETTYVDDFTRASRDEIEWWKLASLSKRLKKRMIGCSDGFDLSNANSDMLIMVYGLVSRLFLKSLREKVRRGMGGAAKRRTCLGKPSLGFTRCVCRDENGNVVVGSDGHPTYRQCIDPETRQFRVLLYELFVEKRWTTYQIAKHFNRLKVENWDGWSAKTIGMILWNATAIGVFIWNKTRREYDPEKEKVVVLQNPRSEWEVHFDRSLAIIPMEWYRAARRRLAASRRNSPLAGRQPKRYERSARTLFSGTLVCADCKRELTLYRSSGKYKDLCCCNGRNGGVRGCTLTTSKSTHVIEPCLVGFLQQYVLTEEAIERLVVKANACLLEEASRPPVETTSLKKGVRENEEKIKKLFKRLEGQKNEDLCQAYDKQIAEYQKELNRSRAELRNAEAKNVLPPPPLNLENVKALLAEFPKLLNMEIPAAAEAIRSLTGPIMIRQEAIPGRCNGATWIATFSPDLVAFLCRTAKLTNCPDSMTLVHLSTRKWIIPDPHQVVLKKASLHEVLSAKAAALNAGGASVATIATALRTTHETIKAALAFADAGTNLAIRPIGLKQPQKRATAKSRQIAEEVVRLREQERWSFNKIAKHFKVCESTVRRAFDHLRLEAVQSAAAQGVKPNRGTCRRLPPQKFLKIEELLRKNVALSEIASRVGCGRSTVAREERRLNLGIAPNRRTRAA